MPATGKKFASDDSVLARLRRLEKKVEAIKNGTLDINMGGATQEQDVVVDVAIDGSGHVTSVTHKAFYIVDGIIEGIED